MRDLAATSILLGVTGLLGCDGAATETAADPEKAEQASPARPPVPESSAGIDKAAAVPTNTPSGAVHDAAGPLLVQSCDESHPCPDELHDAGVEHCDQLRLGDYDDWRLPYRKEIEHLGQIEGLFALDGYHWTASVDEANASMFWIADPKGTQPTTLPPDRKPFRIRCVHELDG